MNRKKQRDRETDKQTDRQTDIRGRQILAKLNKHDKHTELQN